MSGNLNASTLSGLRGAILDKLVTAINALSGATGLVMVALVGVTIPSVWSLQGDVGGMKATLVAIDKRLDDIDKKLESIENKIGEVSKRADAIEMRLATKESDPAALVAQSGLRPASEFGGVRVGEKLYALPKTDKAAQELASSGMKRESITPSAFGYVLGTYDRAGRLVPVATGSTSSVGSAADTRPTKAPTGAGQ